MNSQYSVSQIIISLAILMMISYFWSQFMAERFRMRIRTIRDDLFDWMADNNQPFEAEEYRYARQMLNGMMRLSNTYGPIEFILLMWVFIDSKPSTNAFYRMVDSPLKRKLSEVRVAATREWSRYLFCEGFTGLFTHSIWYACKAVGRMSQMKEQLFSHGEKALDAAFAFGSSSLTIPQKAILAR